MEWLRKYAAFLSVGLATAIALCSMTAFILGSIHAVTRELTAVECRLGDKINEIDKRLIRIETVLLMQGILPRELVAREEINN